MVEAPERAAVAPPDLECLFAELVAEWRRHTAHFSSITEKSIHPTYQRIIGLGPAALPLIFRELQERGGHWDWALTAITGDDPIGPELAGNITAIREVWLAYGRDHGYL